MRTLIAAATALTLSFGTAAFAQTGGATGTPPYNPMAPAPGASSAMAPIPGHDPSAHAPAGAGVSADCPSGGVNNQLAANQGNSACANGSGAANPAPGNPVTTR